MADVTLRTVLQDSPFVHALRDGSLSSPRINFEFIEVMPVTKGFKPMANDLEYDVAEMALVTYLLARAHNRPLTAIPVALPKNTVLADIAVKADSPLKSLSELNGKTVGVRAYTQTTAVWVKGWLAEQQGIDLSSIQWVVYEGAHVDTYKEPGNVKSAGKGPNAMTDSLLAGDVDASFVDIKEDARLRNLVPDHAAAQAEWVKALGIRPWNHTVSMRSELVQQHPWLPAELYRLLVEARKDVEQKNPLPMGVEGISKTVSHIARHAKDQGIIDRVPAAAEIFEPVG
jgi:4,5-dihydroxyphthalate decarboxylase